MQLANVVDLETEKILKETENIYGLKNGKEVLRNYASYIEMRKNGKIDFGTYNILIQSDCEYNSAEEVVKIVSMLLKNKVVINTGYKWLSRDTLRKNNNGEYKNLKKIEEELLIIDIKKMDVPYFLIQEEILEILEKFKNKVFIIIIKNKTDEIKEKLGDFFSWNFEIEQMSKEEKVDYIKQFAQKNKMIIDKDAEFIGKLSDEPFWIIKDEMYNLVLQLKLKDIEKMEDNTVKNILKKEYFDKKTKQKKNKKKTAIQELDSLIGIENVKVQIRQIINYIKINKDRGMMPTLHMCFRGNPGTGKTTVARIVGRIFSEEKILSENDRFVEAQRSDLIGEYVGHTAPKTKGVIKKAKGGVLFIDEAYNLSPRGSDKDYGYECIATLIKEIEDNRDNLCVILAGYTNEMNEMLKVNPGFESRIQFKVDFPDYTEDELYEIFKKMAKDEKYKLSNNIKNLLKEEFCIEKRESNFANARAVRNLFEKIKFEQADRVAENKDEDINLIKKCDVENAISKLEKKEKVQKRIGFAC